MNPLLRWAVVGAALFWAGHAGAAEPLPGDLALVPPGAVAMAHVRVGDVRADSASAAVRAAGGPAGAKALAQLDRQFEPKPSNYDRVTAFSLSDGEPKAPPAKGAAPARPAGDGGDVAVIVRCKEPYDRKAALAGFNPKLAPDAAKPRAVYADADGAHALAFVDDVTLIVGTPPAVAAALAERPAGVRFKLAEALTAAAKPRAFTLGLVTEDASTYVFPVDPALADVRAVLVTVDLGASPTLAGAVRFKDAAAAQAARVRLKDQGKKVRELFADRRAKAEEKVAGSAPAGTPRPLAEMPDALDGYATIVVEELLLGLFENPPVAVAGDALKFETAVNPLVARLVAPLLTYAAWTAPGLALGGQPEGLFGPFLFGGTPSGTAQNNLKQIALAMHNYNDTFGKLPTAAVADKDGKPLLSWRVAILPFIEQGPLYQKFKLDEPWDSAHNKKVLADNPMPRVYLLPGEDDKAKATRFQVFTGPGTVFDAKANPKGQSLIAIPDGTSNTILAGVAAAPVDWTRPDDMAFDPKGDPGKLLQRLGANSRPAANGGVYAVAMADGSVRTIKVKVDAATLRNAVTINDGTVINLDP